MILGVGGLMLASCCPAGTWEQGDGWIHHFVWLGSHRLTMLALDACGGYVRFGFPRSQGLNWRDLRGRG